MELTVQCLVWLQPSGMGLCLHSLYRRLILRILSLARFLFLCLIGSFCASTVLAQSDITTWQVDTKHTGVNANETVLTPSFVSTNGNLVVRYAEKVDGQIFAQPLYLSGATSGQLPGNWADGQQHKDVVFVVTENATLYAFDADQEPTYRPNTGFSNPIWSLHLVPAGNKTAVPMAQIDTDSALDIRPLFGDTATPVIDPKGGIIYVVSALKDTGTLPASHPYEQLLWAISLKTGQPVNGSPVVINPQFNGVFGGDNRTPCSQANHVPNTPSDNGCENDNEPAAPAGTIPFYPLHSHLRSALTLDNFNGHNTLYLAYASHSDGQPYSGFIVGYNATTLQQTTEFTTTPDNTFEAGIWMAGASPAIDPALNKMYVITGNGGNWDNKDSNNNPLPAMGLDSQGNVFSKGTNWPMSVLAFDTTPAGTVAYRGQNELQVPFADTSVWFTPAQWDSFNNGDQDLGAGGPLLFDTPAPDGSTKQLLIGGGKAGVMYVLDRTNLGGIDTSQGGAVSSSIPVDFQDDNVVQEITFPNGTGFFNTPALFNNRIYFSGGNSGARSRAVGFNQTTNTYISSTEDASPEGPVDKNAGVFISANGTTNGLVWQTANGIRAWDASNLAKGAIFSQNNIQVDDGSGNPCITPTFSLPIVSGGNVFFSCYQNPTTTGTTTSSSGAPETFVQPSDNKPGYLFVYGQAPVAPGAPTQVPLNVSAQADSESQITVSWTDPDSDQATAHTGFNVFRATCSTCVAVQITSTSDLSFVDTGLETVTATNGSTSTINLTPNTTYFYTVKATNNAGSSNSSNIASATTFPQYSEPGLVAYWPMDEGILQGESANSSVDLTGNGHTAVKDETDGSNEIESTPSGYIGGSWQYHGTTVIDRLVVKNTSDLQFTASQSFSLVAWVNPTTLQGFGPPLSTNGLDGASIIVKSRDQGNEYGLWINLNGQWEARSGTPGGTGTVITGPAATAGAWTQLALVQDGPNNKRYLYVNGKLAGQGTAQDASGGGDLWFGQQNLFPNGPTDQTSTDGFQGNIDEVRVYNSVLTSAQLLNEFSDTVYQATSIQTHAGVPVGVPLYPFGPSGLPTTEARVAPNRSYTLQLNFAQPLSAAPAAVLNAQPGSTQAVQGSVSSVTLDPTKMIVTVTLANVANAQALQLHLTGVTSEAAQNESYDLPFNVLEGDVTGDHIVDNADASAITTVIASNNNNPITAITSANAQFDLNLDGIVNATDASLATSLAGPSLPIQTDVPLAAFKQTSASSSNGGNIAALAVDNIASENSRWESTQGVDPESLVIDLNSAANIHSIVLDWENAAGANYVLQISNNPAVFPEATTPNCSSPNWTTLVNVTGNTSGGIKTYSSLNGNGRFVRMCGTKRTTTFGYSLEDFEVIGSFASAGATPPTITSATSAIATVGQPFSYTTTSSPAASTFNATGLPAGLSLTGAVISGTPTVTGSFTINLSATNATGQTGTATLSLTVNAAAPVITSATTATATVGQPFSYTITSNPAASTFNATGLPTGLTLSGAVLSGTPTATGSFSITLSATNLSGQTGTANLILTVNAAAPVITSTTSAAATVGQPFSYTITSNPAAASFNATGLPAGLGRTGALISGTPTVAGTFNVALSATSSTGQTGTATLVLVISNAAPVLPAAPTGVTPTAVSSSQINLSWTASTTPGVTYSVFRSTTSGFAPSSANQIAQGLTSTTDSDTGLTAATTYFYIVQAVNGAGFTNSLQTSAQTQAASGVTEVLAINAGSTAAVTSATGNTTFIGDTDFVGGNDDAPGQPIIIPAAIANIAAPAAVYADAHQGAVTYTIPNLAVGSTYTVVLHFAELYFGSANSRLFNVSINGVQVLQNFDIFASAGNAKFTAVVQSFPNITPVNGQIVIAFTNGISDQPMVNGIEIQTGGAPVPSAPTLLTAMTASSTQVNLNWTASITPGVTYSVFRSTVAGFTPSTANRIAQNLTATSFSDAALTASTMYYYIVEAANSTGVLSPPSQQVSTSTAAASADVIAINAGSSLVVGNFIGDTDFTGGNDDAPNHAITIPAAIATIAAPAAVYADAHQGAMTYTIPNLTAGKAYTVILHFAELFFTTANSRQFNVSINGTQVLPNFDIFAAAGNASFTAVVQTFPNITPVNGQIVIAFTNGAHDQPMVNGIEIR
jgi:large repetitive protein